MYEWKKILFDDDKQSGEYEQTKVDETYDYLPLDYEKTITGEDRWNICQTTSTGVPARWKGAAKRVPLLTRKRSIIDIH